MLNTLGVLTCAAIKILSAGESFAQLQTMTCLPLERVAQEAFRDRGELPVLRVRIGQAAFLDYFISPATWMVAVSTNTGAGWISCPKWLGKVPRPDDRGA